MKVLTANCNIPGEGSYRHSDWSLIAELWKGAAALEEQSSTGREREQSGCEQTTRAAKLTNPVYLEVKCCL